MKPNRKPAPVLILACISCAVMAFAAPPAAVPAVDVEKVATTRDLTQTDKAADLPEGGAFCCGPVCISNSMFTLASRGYTNLLPGIDDPKRADEQALRKAHIELAERLAGPDYAYVDEFQGASPKRLIRAARRYVQECGYVPSFEYAGWRSMDESIRDADRPSLDWIKQHMSGDRVMWLNIGWYKHDAEANTFNRINGHWVTAVGYGLDERGRKNPNIVIIYDPSSRSGMQPSTDHVEFLHLKSGKLIGHKDMPEEGINADELLGAASGLHMNEKKYDVAILDGVLVMSIAHPTDPPTAEDEGAITSDSKNAASE